MAGAVHKAVGAVEGMSRLILNDPKITMGKAVSFLRQEKLMHKSLVKCLEGIWGYSSDFPGIRHGAAAPGTVRESEANFAITSCEAALRLLVDLDGRRIAQGSEPRNADHGRDS